jgi:hypothetical protein
MGQSTMGDVSPQGRSRQIEHCVVVVVVELEICWVLVIVDCIIVTVLVTHCPVKLVLVTTEGTVEVDEEVEVKTVVIGVLVDVTV